ncbi:MAG: hypothetical protein JWL72_1525 [Ilumatobacteraceae bacterium]|nr:hypothetical protein [Ilumatobacteraceae bacterium]MCU1388187.1 hypothetical protein [Ilumatobacteraceae bacterium]
MNAHIVSPHRRSSLSVAPVAAAAAVLTMVAATVAWLLSSVAHLSQNVVVLTVMVAAFAASWAVTNRRPERNHRVTVVKVRVPAR